MKLKNNILIAMLFVGMLILLQNVCYAGTQRLNSLDYDVQLNVDGSMDVIETWDIYISETNTLFKDFELDSSKYAGISNVKVKNSSTGEELTQIDQEMYHVTKNCYYALPISDGKFEIAWGVGLDNSSATRKYQISYTVEDAITVYNDCSELYWMFLNQENGVPADQVTGTIKLPSAVNDIEKLRVWAHGPLNGEIKKTSNDTVEFWIDNFDSNTMLETRIVVEEPIFKYVKNKYSFNKLADILEEEERWADEANRQREQAKNICYAINGVVAIIAIFFLFKIIKYIRELNEMKNKRYHIDIGEYFRDIPREKDATPAEAAFLYYSKKNSFFTTNSNVSRIFSATLLQLCLKKYISFEIDERENIQIDRLKFLNEEDSNLKESEKIVFRILTKVAFANGKNQTTMKEIKNYAGSHYEEFGKMMEQLEMRGKEAQIELQNYDDQMAKKAMKYNLKALQYFFLPIIFLMVAICIAQEILGLGIYLLVVFLECFICGGILRRIGKQINVLTEKGEMERQQWIGLAKYTEDFSLLKEREVPDLILWEKYLVYATVFGISDKVIEQLKVVYPQMQNLDSNTCTYMYLMSDSRFSKGFVNQLNESTNSVYNAYRSAYSAAHSSSSSGSGSGGGFSSGGGGRRWRR